MNVAEPFLAPPEKVDQHLCVAEQRSPPTAVKVLIPTWGLGATQQFLEFCLPTLLAPGNLPALAQDLPCTVVIMTSARDEPLIRRHPAWHPLNSICRVETRLIDDLITCGNHTTTLTLAYAREVRETGTEMVNTCFIFLVADYLFADGALASVLTRMQAGASAVLACNFQMVAEDVMPVLRRRMRDQAGVEMSLTARELLKLALRHLHSATVANIVNFKLTHNEHANRLFWRVDQNTLIGRPYLMHMIGIRPEVTEFVVGSSSDYSFVPEMCPSNNVFVFTDSDEYLVVEMQASDHEKYDVQLGPFDPKRLASTLAEWTTARHRENAQHTIVYHAEDIPDNIEKVAAEAETFIDRVAGNLQSPPQPHRMHPYWIGAITAHLSATGQRLSAEQVKLLGKARGRTTRFISLLSGIRVAIFGAIPDVKPCHPRWADFCLPMEALHKALPANGRLLIVSDMPHIYARWTTRFSMESLSIEGEYLLNLTPPHYSRLVESFDVCLLCLDERDLKYASQLVTRLAPLLKRGGLALIFIINVRTDDLESFSLNIAHHAERFSNLPLWLSEIQFVRMSKLRWNLQRVMVRLARASTRRPLLYLPVVAIAGGFLVMASYLCNLAAKRSRFEVRGGFCSSVLIALNLGGMVRFPISDFDSDEVALLHRAGYGTEDDLLEPSPAERRKA